MFFTYHISNCIKPVLLFFLALLNIETTAQLPSLNFHHLTTANGLSNPIVRSITSDKYGYIWLGTINGLNRFNGYDVKIIQHQPGNPLSLADNVIQSLYCDEVGNLWIAPSKGIYKYDYSNSNFILQDGSSDISAGKMLQVTKGLIYIATNKGLVVFDTKVGILTALRTISEGDVRNMLTSRVNDFCIGNERTIYIATDSGLIVFDIKSNTARRVKLKPVKNNIIENLVSDKEGNLWVSYYENGPLLLKTDTAFTNYDVYRQFLSPQNKIKDNNINSMLVDNRGRIWVTTTRQGLGLYNPPGNNFIQYEHDPLQSMSISTDFTNSLYQDKEGFMWTGTEGYGAEYFHPDKNLFHSIQQSFIQTPTLPDNWSRAAGEDKEHNLWLGTAKGLAKYDPRKNKYTIYQNTTGNPDVLHSNSIRSILCEDDIIWIGTAIGLNRFTISTGKMEFLGNKDSIPYSFFWSIIKDHESNVWFGSRDGLYRYNHKTKKIETLTNDPLLAPYCKKNIRVLFEDSHNRLWIGFYAEGLLMYDPANNEVQYFQKNINNKTSLNDENITSITEDKSGIIWISTLADFSSYDTKTNTFKHYQNGEANISEIASSLMCDNSNRLWIASSKGMYLLDSSRKFFTTFDQGDGLPSIDFNNQDAFRMHNGNFIYPTLKGFVLFNPADYTESNDSIKVYVSSFKVFGKEYSSATGIEQINKIRLDHDQDFFSLEMTALNYTNPKQNWYAYKLEPFDKDWIYTKDRLVNYTNVPGGNYIFHYKTSTDHENWKVPEKKITIAIATVIYKTWWFRILIATVVLLTLYSMYKFRINQKEKV
ncbi:MAG: two-component regulator propeller domain-containing protein, partial [Chitinophagaceae bacterium]